MCPVLPTFQLRHALGQPNTVPPSSCSKTLSNANLNAGRMLGAFTGRLLSCWESCPW